MDTIEVIKKWVERNSEVLDLGCGDGEILKILSSESESTVMGVEINHEDINSCIKSGLNVIQQNIDEGLENFGDKSFDVVIMSQTIQVLKEPKKALMEVTRIGKESIVTIPNFGFLSTRLSLCFQARCLLRDHCQRTGMRQTIFTSVPSRISKYFVMNLQ